MSPLASQAFRDRAVQAGYGSEAYATALCAVGSPHRLPQCGGWILARPIPQSSWHDAIGCYPFFCCAEWCRLENDLRSLDEDLVSVGFVADPLGDWDEPSLERCFPDSFVPFKQHYVVHLDRANESSVHPHHRRNTRKAEALVEVQVCVDPIQYLADWIRLYTVLVNRHHITGVAAFSPESFAIQFGCPGLVAFRAHRDDATLGMLLWFVHGDLAYYHLGAYNDEGYRLRASYALFNQAIRHFKRAGLRVLDLGGGAGVAESAENGLARFKAGWATGTKSAYWCGRIINRARYEQLAGAPGSWSKSFFPAYRAVKSA